MVLAFFGEGKLFSSLENSSTLTIVSHAHTHIHNDINVKEVEVTIAAGTTDYGTIDYVEPTNRNDGKYWRWRKTEKVSRNSRKKS